MWCRAPSPALEAFQCLVSWSLVSFDNLQPKTGRKGTINTAAFAESSVCLQQLQSTKKVRQGDQEDTKGAETSVSVKVGVHFVLSCTNVLDKLHGILVLISTWTSYRPRCMTQMPILTFKSELETKKASTKLFRCNSHSEPDMGSSLIR